MCVWDDRIIVAAATLTLPNPPAGGQGGGLGAGLITTQPPTHSFTSSSPSSSSSHHPTNHLPRNLVKFLVIIISRNIRLESAAWSEEIIFMSILGAGPYYHSTPPILQWETILEIIKRSVLGQGGQRFGRGLYLQGRGGWRLAGKWASVFAGYNFAFCREASREQCTNWVPQHQ